MVPVLTKKSSVLLKPPANLWHVIALGFIRSFERQQPKRGVACRCRLWGRGDCGSIRLHSSLMYDCFGFGDGNRRIRVVGLFPTLSQFV